jgi:isoleucyl-tRNA synthetase
MFLDETKEKMSNTRPEFLLDPVDFIEGSVKMSGERKYGYGVDVMRAWAATKDTDKSMLITKEQLDQINNQVKLLRQIFRSMLGYLNKLDVNTNAFKFDELTIVDKMMMVKLL